MRKLLLLACLACLAAASFATLIRKGTDVRLAFDEQLSSKTAKVGDKVKMHVVDDVVVEGHVTIRKGTPAVASVTQVNRGRHFGVNATIRLRLDPVATVDGTMVPIEPRYKGKKTGEKTDKAALASAGGAVILGPVGIGIGYFIAGKSVNVKVGDTIVTEVSKDTDVSGSVAPTGV